MKTKKVAIIQSNYISWKGYFDLINNIIFNARETIIHNHLLSHQVDQFKSFYNKIVYKL